MYLKLRQIAVSEENYPILKSLGKAGDSFNDVVSEMLKVLKLQRPDYRVGPSNQTVADHKPPLQEDCEHA
jgi:predicted CopG family antitoxin